MAANAVCVSFEFDIFADRPVQTSTEKIVEIAHKTIISVDQSDLKFVIPQNDNSYIVPNMQIYIKGQLVGAAGAELSNTDYTARTISYNPYSVSATSV
jgi:hypothetical protein